jgi:hypothetical protein
MGFVIFYEAVPVQFISNLSEITQSGYHGSFVSNRLEKNSPRRIIKMKSIDLRSSEGKGLVGCLAALVLFAVAIYLGITLGPIYYSNFSFENGVKTTASRAGAHFLSNEAIVTEIMDIAKREEIRIKKENIEVDRFAGQVHIKVSYSVPVNFIILDRDLEFKIQVSSFIGTL